MLMILVEESGFHGMPPIVGQHEIGHRTMRVLRRHRATPGSLTFVASAAAVWPGIALAQQSAGKACAYLGPYKKIDAALGDGKR
jgi:hypothetical protein